MPNPDYFHQNIRHIRRGKPCCLHEQKRNNILIAFSQQTYVNLSQYDNSLYANVNDLTEEEITS